MADELGVNADFVYTVPVDMFSVPLDIGFGVEYRDEGYEIVAGDEASYIAGPYGLQDPWNFCSNEATVGAQDADCGWPWRSSPQARPLNCALASDPVYTQNAVGSDGFPGYPPAFSEALEPRQLRRPMSISPPTSRTTCSSTSRMRFENYSDFGETFDYKLAGRWKLTARISTFAAPSARASVRRRLASCGTTNVSTVFGGGGEPIARVSSPRRTRSRAFLGARELQPEKSDNYSLGATGSFVGFDVTLDFYKIDHRRPVLCRQPDHRDARNSHGSSRGERARRRHDRPGVILPERLRLRNLRRRPRRQLRR